MRRAAALLVLAAALVATLAGCGSGGLGESRLAASISGSFARLYTLQQAQEGNPKVSAQSLKASATCVNETDSSVTSGPGTWLCSITYYVAGPGYPVIAKYKVDLKPGGCYAADGDGPQSVNGYPTITGPRYKQLINPLALIDSCFNTL
jgi:ABC-2 type transport system permease protein